VSRVLVTPPTQEPLTLAEVARHLRLDSRNVEPAPDAPTVALGGAGAGNVDNGAHRYRFTFVTSAGETDGGAISSSVTVVDKTANGRVALSNIPVGGTAVTARNLYRTTAGGSNYFLVAQLADNTTTVYVDNIADASLGAGVPVTNTTYDADLADLLARARQHLENAFGRAFLTQTWRVTLDQFPCGGIAFEPHQYHTSRRSYGDTILLPMPVLQSVTSITYVDGAGAVQTLPTSVYDVDTDHFPGRVVLKYGQMWPIPRAQRNAVVITFVAGFASPALVPATWRAALKLLIGHWHNNADDGEVSVRVRESPESVDALMWPDRYLEVA
jgi:uncharacterized phiE125 gp8 family phage protein